MIETRISGPLLGKCPDLHLGLINCQVENSRTHNGLSREIWRLSDHMLANMPMNLVNIHPPIEATRKAYKACGKDPNRYRSSAEAMRRRIIKGDTLPRVNTVVDTINFLSLRSGLSMNGFDGDKIVGGLEWDIGKRDEPFEAIGRGKFNVKKLPVVRDREGVIGSPSSDSVRTMISDETSHLFLIIPCFGGHFGLEKTVENAIEMLMTYAKAQRIQSACMGPQF